MLKDMKEALTGARKPDLTHVRRAFGVYIARPCEYGCAKGYERANYLRPAGPPADERQRAEPMAADFLRLRAYLRAAKSHIDAAIDALEQHEAGDPTLTDRAGMLAAAYAADTDTMPGAPIGASGLPHIAHAAASVQIAICQAVRYGLLPEDPGRPWDALDMPERHACAPQAPADPHAALRAEIAAAGLPPAPDEALEGRKLVRGRTGGWAGIRSEQQGRDCDDVWLCAGDWSPWWNGTDDKALVLVPKDWI